MARLNIMISLFFFFSSRRRHTRFDCDWSSDVCSSDLTLGFQQHQQRTASTLIFRGLAEGEDFVALRQPSLYFSLQYRLSSRRAQALSMDHANAAQSAPEAPPEKLRQQQPGFLPVQPVQIDEVLHDP